jgi:hypothetical protein
MAPLDMQFLGQGSPELRSPLVVPPPGITRGILHEAMSEEEEERGGVTKCQDHEMSTDVTSKNIIAEEIYTDVHHGHHPLRPV